MQMKFMTYGKEFIEVSSDRLAPTSIANYKSALVKLEPHLGEKDIADIRKNDLLLVAKALRDSGLSTNRAKYVMQIAVMILNDAQENELREKRFLPVKFPREEAKAPAKLLTAREIDKVIEHCDPHYQSLFKFLFYTGCRPSEACGLKWSDISEDSIHICRAAVRGEVRMTKSAKGRRDIPLTMKVKEVLLSTPKLHKDWVFVSKQVGLIDNSHLNRIWRRACEKAKVREAKSYWLRHSFVSVAAKNGVDLAYISKHVGHSNINTTYRFYHSIFNGESEDRNRLERAFK
jgi:integrase